MKIITLTLNPAIDVHCSAKSFELYHESVADITGRDAGGKGINISRALDAVGVENTAYVVLGKENGEQFGRQLKGYGIDFVELETEGRIRENITIHTPEKPETRLSFRGFSATDRLIDELEELISAEIDDETYITFTGSIPQGITHDRIIGFLCGLKKRGVKLVIDSKSITKEDLIKLQPWLIKPNEEEVAEYTGYFSKTAEGYAEGAKKLNEYGIENVMITLGEQGALLATGGNVIYASVPEINVMSTIGAGDSSIAGFLYAKKNGEPVEQCLRSAVAFGCGACMREGTNPPTENDIKQLIGKITLS